MDSKWSVTLWLVPFLLLSNLVTLQFKVRSPSHELNRKDLYLIFPRQNQTGHGNHFNKRIHLNFSETIHHSQSISSQTLAKRIISTTLQIKLVSNDTRSSSNKIILGFWHPITFSIFIHQIIYVDYGRITSLWEDHLYKSTLSKNRKDINTKHRQSISMMTSSNNFIKTMIYAIDHLSSPMTL